jgi:amino-acid N-acetyltransferase
MERYPSIRDITIRPATADDLPHVLTLLTGARLVTAGVRDHLDTFRVAVEGDHIAGTAGLEMYGDVALLRSVAVVESFRGRGLGWRLVREALAEARRRGVRQIALLTDSAASFFSRLGFQQVDRGALDQRLLASKEFADPCCATAITMMLNMDTRSDLARSQMSETEESS